MHIDWWVLLAAGIAMVFLLLVWMTVALPSLRLRQAGKHLRRIMEHPEEETMTPRALRSIGGELADLRLQLERQDGELREQERRRQELIAFLAHDLKTPLTSVLGYLELLRDEPGLSEEQRAKYTDIALDKARRLEELVGEFFDINTMDLKLDKTTPVQVSFLLEQLADEFYPLFTSKDLKCEPDIQPHLVVRGDGDRLARVFDNILRNAVSYSSPGGAVGLTARGVGENAVVTVTNQGLEIPEGELSNIFEKFYRLDAARSTRTGGAGLGLAIAKEIVELHGGTIRAESTGSLTAFVITLPLCEKGGEAEYERRWTGARASAGPQGGPRPARDGGKRSE